MRGCFVGSGSEGLQQPEVYRQIMDLAQSAPAETTVLYLGTATYDLPGPKHNQTVRFSEAGCTISEIVTVGDSVTPAAQFAELCGAADIIIVSGGNTLWAIDKWTAIGLVPYLRAAAERGAVLTGGSAGAICWYVRALHLFTSLRMC